MALIEEQALKNIVSKNDKNVFLILGEDDYLKKFYVEKIVRKITDLDDVFNYQRFENDCDLQTVYDAVQQFPVMNDKKCVVLRDFDFKTAAKEDIKKLNDLICDVPDTTILILWFDTAEIDVKKNNKFKEILKAAESVGGVGAYLKHRGVSELEKMLSDGAVKRGCRFEPGAVKFLVQNSGEDINNLRTELDKLCAFVKDGVITKSVIEQVAVKTIESSIFDLNKKIIKCELDDAFAILDDLFFMREEPIIILSTISSVYVDMHRVLAARASGVKIDEVQSQFGYGNKTFVLNNAEYNLKNFDFYKLKLSFDALIEADKRLKSFKSDARIVLEQLIIKLSYIAVKGEAID